MENLAFSPNPGLICIEKSRAQLFAQGLDVCENDSVKRHLARHKRRDMLRRGTFGSSMTKFERSPMPRNMFQPCKMNYETPKSSGGRVMQHTLHVLVDDEAGILTRVVGLFSRRGYNIDSLAVGLTNQRALITMVVPGDDSTISHLNRQLLKLINVLKVQDITELPRVERELMLLKVEANEKTRTEILGVVEIFRARVVEITNQYIIIEATGDPGKTAALQKVLHKHPVKELARTGKIALLRESQVDSHFLRLHGASSNAPQPLFDPEMLGPEFQEDEFGENGGEVVNLPVEYVQSPPKGAGGQKLHTLQVLVEDVAGILARVTSLFARRGYNIESLAVGTAEKAGLSRITMVVPGDEVSIEQMKRQITRLVHVLKVEDITDIPTVQRELMLMKVNAEYNNRTEIIQIAKVYRARILDVGDECLTVEVTGDPGKMAAMQEMLRKFGIREIARTGKVALVRESRVNTNVVTAGAWTLEPEPVNIP
mmetsp:Transcript_3456/g.5243  ORF Transcript_3456/g.5243 Transcript_3456/m.5243 type:complete len:484 (-) Transcript_3456:979-2430(-)